MYMARATRSARPRSLDHTEAESPNWGSLASSRAWASEEKGYKGRSGPKFSSLSMRISGVTPSTTMGGINADSPSQSSPVRKTAPLSLASATLGGNHPYLVCRAHGADVRAAVIVGFLDQLPGFGHKPSP